MHKHLDEAANVLGVRVHAVNMDAALARIHQLIHEDGKGYICVAGVHGVMEAQRSLHLRRVYENATMTVPDGMPLVWVGHLQGRRSMGRVTGPDLMLALFTEPQFRDTTHFFYGGENGVANALRQNLLSRSPFAQILGTYTPPFRDLTAAEEQDLITEINSLQPDILWVGIGCPRQEIFMARMLPHLNVKLIFGVGAAFDYHTGRIKDCSDWIKRCGLQWLHRLMQDPRRLWPRYLRNNPAFVWHIAGQLLGIHRYELSPTSSRCATSVPTSSEEKLSTGT